MPGADPHPYSGLTPDVVLDALESAGLRRRRPPARAEQLREPRLPDRHRGRDGPRRSWSPSSTGPARWTDAQILEEHAFVRELAEREIPVVAPLVLRGATLHEFGGFRFAVYPRRGGRTPELEDPKTLEWMGRFIGRIHAVGAVRAVRARPALDIESFGIEPRAWLLEHGFIPADLRAAWSSIADRALEGVTRCYERAGPLATHPPARRLPRRQRPVDRRRPALRRLRRRALRAGGAGPVDAAVRRSCRDDATARRRARRLRGFPRVRAARARARRGAAHAASHPLLRRGSRGAGTTRRFPPRFPGSTPSATGRTASSSCASRSRPWTSRRSGAASGDFAPRESRAAESGRRAALHSGSNGPRQRRTTLRRQRARTRPAGRPLRRDRRALAAGRDRSGGVHRRRARRSRGVATAVNVTDGAAAKVHLSAWSPRTSFSSIGVEPILQLTCRDRNRLALQGDLLGAAALGIRNVLVLARRRPAAAGDQPDAKPVFDLDRPRPARDGEPHAG